MLVGDPSSGYSFKCTVTDIANIVETDIGDAYVTLTTTQSISGAKTFSNILTLTSVTNASVNTDKFLVLNASNVVNFRTGAEVLSDIGAAAASSISGTSGQVAYFTGSSSVGGSSTFTFSPTAQLLLNNSVTASSAIARGANLTPSLSAAANNDVLVGLDINPTFTNGAFTGVTNYGLRLSNSQAFFGGSGGIAMFIGASGAIRGDATTNGNLYIDASRDLTGGLFLRASTLNIPSGTSTTSLLNITAIASFNNVVNVNSVGGISSFRLVNTTSSATWYFENNRNAPSGSLEISNSLSNPTITAFSTRNVAINSNTDAGFRLDVNGTARVSEITTTNSGTNNINFFIAQNSSFTYKLTLRAVNNVFGLGNVQGMQGFAGGSTLGGYYINDAGVMTTASATRSVITSYGGNTFNIFAGTYTFGNLNAQAPGNNDASGQCILNSVLNNTFTTGIAQTFNSVLINPSLTTVATGQPFKIRGIYYSPTTVNIASFQHIAFESVSGDVLLCTTSGNVAIGTSTLATATELTLGGSQTASSAIARGGLINTTLVAAANNDVLVGLDIDPTFTNGAFTGVTNLAIRTLSGRLSFTGAAGNGTLNLFTTNSTFLSNASNGVLTFNRNSSSGWQGIEHQVSGALMAYDAITTSGEFRRFANSGGYFQTFYSNGVEAIRLSTSQNLLIGTTTDAGFRLDVTGTARIGSTTNNISFSTSATANFLTQSFSSSYFVYLFPTNNSYSITASRETYVLQSGGSTKGFRFENSTGNATMFINTSGGAGSDQYVNIGGNRNSQNNASAILELESSVKGFLPPRMTGAQAEAIATPATGLLVYANNGNGTTITTTGWWGYDGTNWVKLN
jgi:hypothetical protein